MTRPIIVGSPAGVRQFLPQDLPVRVGSGSAADIRVPGPVSDHIVALISVLDERAFLQVTEAQAAPVAVNGASAPGTRWLAEGDVITVGALRIECHFDADALRLSVAYADTDYATLPPVRADAGESGEIAPRRAQAAPPRAGLGARRWRWAVYAALVILGSLAFDLFTARAVRVSVTPAEAAVHVDGSWLPVRIGERFLLHEGSYGLRVEAEGYEPEKRDITVGPDANQQFHVALRPLPGWLALDVKPTVPVILAVDGTPQAPTAAGRYRVPAGAHALTVTARRFQAFEARVTVEGRGIEQKLTVELKPNWADVAVNSEPAGAAIRVGDEELGVTPATVPVIAGGAEIEVRKDGYKSWRETLAVNAGEQLALPLIRLEESDGLLAVATTPAGAAVAVDGRFRGSTPLEVDIAPGRAHEVIVAKPGYDTITRTVTVASRGAERLSLPLAQRTGVVRFEAQPADAELLVNGESRGRASQELVLPAVPQHVEIRKDGFVSFKRELTPTPGLPQVVRAELLTPQQAVLAATPQTLTTKQGLSLVLVHPGSFEMGAPRREQGRRANEAQHRVRLTRAFYIGTREVTNREFREFRPNHTSGAETYKELAGSDHPAVMLSWEDAAAFCNWLSSREGLQPAYATVAGAERLASPATNAYRLPTEAEWEWATRYNGGGGERRYPWGDEMPPPEGSGNFADQSAKAILPNVLPSYNDGYPVTSPVGSFKPSPLGLYDTGGNAAEWVNDFYTVYASDSAELTDPTGPASGQYHVIRGSSWRHASISELRYAYRDFGEQGRLDVGFRIARYAD